MNGITGFVPPVLRHGTGLLAGLFVPPIGVVLSRGTRVELAINCVLTFGAIAVFMRLFAGPGLILYLAAIVHAESVAIRSLRRRGA